MYGSAHHFGTSLPRHLRFVLAAHGPKTETDAYSRIGFRVRLEGEGPLEHSQGVSVLLSNVVYPCLGCEYQNQPKAGVESTHLANESSNIVSAKI